MATVVRFDRRRRFTRPAAPPEQAATVEEFWRKVVLPITVVAGVFLVIGLGLGIAFYITGALPHGYETAALITIIIAVVGLTKIIFANALFFIMMSEERATAVKPATRMAPRPATIRVPVRSRRPLPHRRGFQ